MTIIGLTGRIGAGKSTAAAYLRQWGAAVIDADQIGHQIIAKGKPAYEEILAAFPGDFLQPSGEIDRKKLAKAVFGDPDGQFVHRLNAITHPRITAEVAEAIQQFLQQQYRHVVVEAALLLQSDLPRLVEQIWLITAPEAVTLPRLRQRDGMSESQARARLAAQLSEEAQRAAADLVIENDGDLACFAQKLRQAYDSLDKE